MNQRIETLILLEYTFIKQKNSAKKRGRKNIFHHYRSIFSYTFSVGCFCDFCLCCCLWKSIVDCCFAWIGRTINSIYNCIFDVPIGKVMLGKSKCLFEKETTSPINTIFTSKAGRFVFHSFQNTHLLLSSLFVDFNCFYYSLLYQKAYSVPKNVSWRINSLGVFHQ